MATLAPINTPSRQPFGLINDSKLRQLQSIKNRQNAILPSSSSSNLKRRAPSPEISDSENVDPSLFDLIGKRKRSAFDEDVSLSKPSRYSLNTISQPRNFTPATPRVDTILTSATPISAPASAPAAAGRSPTKPKSRGLLPSKKRFFPPAFGIQPAGLSVSQALKGTISTKRPRKVRTLEDSKPKSWSFDIFEEPEQVQNDRMNEWTLSQGASFLDVSDDESKSKERNDRGKENIDPNQIAAPVTRSMAAAQAAAAELKKDIMADDRYALAELNPAKYYAEGLDATSVVLVPDDTSEEVTEPAIDDAQPTVAEDNKDFTFQSLELPSADETANTSDIAALIASSVPTWDVVPTAITPQETKDNDFPAATSEDIEIWESESAKDETEKAETGSVDGGDVFALQEL